MWLAAYTMDPDRPQQVVKGEPRAGPSTALLATGTSGLQGEEPSSLASAWMAGYLAGQQDAASNREVGLGLSSWRAAAPLA